MHTVEKQPALFTVEDKKRLAKHNKEKRYLHTETQRNCKVPCAYCSHPCGKHMYKMDVHGEHDVDFLRKCKVKGCKCQHWWARIGWR